MGANAPAGYNYQANANLYNPTNLNNQAAKDSFGNPIALMNTNNAMGSLGMNQQQQQQQQQQQMFGANAQPQSNPSYNGGSFYSGAGGNQLLRDTNANTMMRDSNGNAMPSGSAGSSLYSSGNSQMPYQPNNNINSNNQLLTNKDLYNAPAAAANTNNNQFGYNSNVLPNANAYGGQTNMNGNTNAWQTANHNNQYSGNAAGNPYYTNRDANANLNTNNNNNNNAYSNSPYLFNGARRTAAATISTLLIVGSFLVTCI